MGGMGQWHSAFVEVAPSMGQHWKTHWALDGQGMFGGGKGDKNENDRNE
jgi:hypothetical protein